jgi:putative RNA 2'-phosphotransferase
MTKCRRLKIQFKQYIFLQNNSTNSSKFLSLILRHHPEKIGITLDENGWADVDELLAKMNAAGTAISKEILSEVVSANDKQRFAFNSNQTQIRASQGHSVNIDLDLKEQIPPAFLYHGTVAGFISSIQAEGLQKMQRTHVHLSADIATAQKVGSRRGKPVILTIQSGQMYKDGLQFFLSANGVWLTNHVPSVYIQF